MSETRALAAELCRQFYALGWVFGTGGSITIKAHDDSVPRSHQLIVMSPSGTLAVQCSKFSCFICSGNEISSNYVMVARLVAEGVQKETMLPGDMFVLSSDGIVLSSPLPRSYSNNPNKCTDSALLFMKVFSSSSSSMLSECTYCPTLPMLH